MDAFKGEKKKETEDYIVFNMYLLYVNQINLIITKIDRFIDISIKPM